jgi:hypothetical protein
MFSGSAKTQISNPCNCFYRVPYYSFLILHCSPLNQIFNYNLPTYRLFASKPQTIFVHFHICCFQFNFLIILILLQNSINYFTKNLITDELPICFYAKSIARRQFFDRAVVDFFFQQKISKLF